jgi:hypothetical protein
VKTCDYCGRENEDSFETCRECGSQLLSGVAQVTESPPRPPQQSATRRRDPLAVVAFLLALFIMICPTEADILDPAFRSHRYGLAAVLAVAFFSVVFIPFFLAWRRFRREPTKWRGRGFLIATGVILTLNVFVWLAAISISIYQLFR